MNGRCRLRWRGIRRRNGTNRWIFPTSISWANHLRWEIRGRRCDEHFGGSAARGRAEEAGGVYLGESARAVAVLGEVYGIDRAGDGSAGNHGVDWRDCTVG